MGRAENEKFHRKLLDQSPDDDDILKIDPAMQNGSQRLPTGNISRCVSGELFRLFLVGDPSWGCVASWRPRIAAPHRNGRTRNAAQLSAAATATTVRYGMRRLFTTKKRTRRIYVLRRLARDNLGWDLRLCRSAAADEPRPLIDERLNVSARFRGRRTRVTVSNEIFNYPVTHSSWDTGRCVFSRMCTQPHQLARVRSGLRFHPVAASFDRPNVQSTTNWKQFEEPRAMTVDNTGEYYLYSRLVARSAKRSRIWWNGLRASAPDGRLRVAAICPSLKLARSRGRTPAALLF